MGFDIPAEDQEGLVAAFEKTLDMTPMVSQSAASVGSE